MTTFAPDLAPERASWFSARGRSTRQEYWISVGVLVGAQALISVVLHGGGLGLIVTFFWVRTYSRRLHDLGQSGWMQCLLYAAQLVAMAAGMIWAWPEIVAAGRPHLDGATSLDTLWPLALAATASFILQAGYTLWLGVYPGDVDDNRYGPSPRAENLAATFA